jgi:hypothetical protein
MIEHLQILTEIGEAASAGVFIPVTDVAGMTGGEIADTGATLEGKLAYGFLNGFFGAVNTVNPLGFGDSDKTSPAGTGDNTYTEGIETLILRLTDLRTGQIKLPPLPTTGSFAGQGKLLLTDCWPNCTFIAEAEESTGTGIIIPNTWIIGYGGTIPATVEDDAREWWAALIFALAASLTARTTTVNSAITFIQNLTTNRLTGAVIPISWYNDTNPEAQLAATDLPFVRLTQERIRIDYELVTDPINQTFEVNIATS